MLDAGNRLGSEVHLDEWVSPNVCDEHGELRAGQILEWMDVVGVLAASRHCQRPVVTVSVDGMELRDPIVVGERVTMTAAVAFTSERSIGVTISVFHARSGSTKARSVEGYMTFAALGDDGRPLPVPRFSPSTPEEQTHFREGTVRREFRQKLAAGELSLAAPEIAPGPPADQHLFIRELLKLLPRSLRMPWERDEPPKPRARDHSYVHTIEPVRVTDLNFHGTLYGGSVMRWIEATARLSAQAYLDGAAVRLSALHGLTFIRPVEANVFVHIRAAVAHSSTTALTVLVNVDAEDPIAGRHVETLRAFLTYAPATSRDRPAAIPPIECISDSERALFEEVAHRVALQRALAPPDEAR